MSIAFIFSLLFSVLVLVFALQNSASVTINFLFTKYTMTQAIVILLSAVIGAIIVLLLSTVKQIKLNLKIRNLTKQVSRLEEAKLLKEKEDLVQLERVAVEDRELKAKEEMVHIEKLEEENRLLKEKDETLVQQ